MVDFTSRENPENPENPLFFEDIYTIIQRILFSKPLGSHSKLHEFRLRYRPEVHVPYIHQKLALKMPIKQIREEVRHYWRLYRDYEDAAKHLPNIPSRPESQRDLASWTITECPQCFICLLLLVIILPSYFNDHGYSFFILASTGNSALACDLISRIGA
jgi:hypothetical protein